MDELDTANEKMDEFVGTPVVEEDEAALEDSGEQTAQERIEEWWAQAKTLDAKELSPAIVSCRLSSRTQFMTRDECLNRGGRPASASI